MGNHGMGKSTTQQLNTYSFPPPEKSPLNKFISPATISVILFPWNSNFHLITLYSLHL